MTGSFDMCDIAPPGSDFRSWIAEMYNLPAWKNGYIRCEDICFHDICVQDVRLIYQNKMDFCLELPDPRELAFSPEESYVVVKCTEEKLRDCSYIHMKIKYDVVVVGTVPGRPERKCYLVWQCQEETDITTFYTFKGWRQVTGDDLCGYLRLIDGSSVVIDLDCELKDGYVHIHGNIVDKLWKEENLVVLAAKPFGGVTVKHEFQETEIPDCDCRRR
ncbi:hypothetical protein [Syntrophomonas curvata]